MKGNDRERQRNRIEDALIRKADRSRVINAPPVVDGPLTARIIDILAVKGKLDIIAALNRLWRALDRLPA